MHGGMVVPMKCKCELSYIILEQLFTYSRLDLKVDCLDEQRVYFLFLLEVGDCQGILDCVGLLGSQSEVAWLIVEHAPNLMVDIL
jgi:hypothetical protein